MGTAEGSALWEDSDTRLDGNTRTSSRLWKPRGRSRERPSTSTEGGQEGQGRSPRRSQDCQEDRAHAEGHRVLWTLKQLYVLMYRLVHELSSHCVRLVQLQLLK